MKTKILARAAGFVINSGWFSAFMAVLMTSSPPLIGTFLMDFLVIWGAILSVTLGIVLLNYDS